MMHFAICDDDVNFCTKLEKYLREFFSSHKLGHPEISIFHSGEEILDSNERFDIIFIDVEMSGLSGIHAGKELLARNPHSLYIVITAFDDYLDEALHFNAFRYLSKPLDKLRLFRNLKDAMAMHTSNNQKIAISTKDAVYSVFASDIIMVEAKDRKVFVYTTNNTYTSTEKINYWARSLNKHCFFRTHRSYIINMQYINNFNNTTVYLADNKYAAYLTVRKYTEFKRAYLLFLECS